MAGWGRKLATAAVKERNGVSISVLKIMALCTHMHMIYEACLPSLAFWRVFKHSQKIPFGEMSFLELSC